MIKLWLERHWVAGSLFMGCALLAVVPTGIGGSDPARLLILLASPLYMLHQVEEHWGDRFRAYVNARLFGGVEALTTGDILWINLPGVWGVNLAALYAAAFVDPGYGLAAPYLLLVNGVAHAGMALRFRDYNPGLATGIIFFLPLAVTSLLAVPATLGQEVLGCFVALSIHAAIAIRVKMNRARFAGGSTF